jgi:hypothetical protein
LASHFGALVQATYTHTGDHFSIDNSDLRYANQAKLAARKSITVFGVNYSFRWTTTISPYERHLPPSGADDIYLRFG